MAPSTTTSMFNRLRGKVSNEPPDTNPSYAGQYRQRVIVPPSITDLGLVEYGNTPPPLSSLAAYSYAPPPSPQGTQSDFYYAPADQSQTSLQTPTYPIAPDAPEGWHAQWVQSQNRFAFKKDGTSIITWVDDSPISESRAAYYVTGERATTIELLQIYMKRQPNTHGQPLIDRGLFEKEGVEWGISDSNRLIYDSIFESYAPTEGYISLPFASNMFQQTGMSNVVAGLILDLVRPKDPGESLLNMARFAVAMHLIYRTLNDYPVPTALPYQLTSVLTSELSNPAIIASQPAPPPASKPALVPPEPRLPEDGDWSGRGQHVEYLRNEAIPLVVSDHLGRGASADVHKVTTTGGVVVARKLIYCARAVKLDDVKRELEILRKVDHKHVIKLVGSYTQGRQLGILLYPAAVCDLGTFLDEIDEQQKSGENEVNDQLWAVLDNLGMFRNRPEEYNSRSWSDVSTSAHRRLRSSYGCLVSGLEYLHQKDIRHKDIKTRNVLLDKSNGLFITDFGISRDNTDASTSVTNGIERGTYKYCAPEVATYEPRGRAADIYSLGCVFLEMETVYRGVSLLEFDTLRKENDVDSSFQANPEKLTEWINKLRSLPNKEDKSLGIFHIVDLIQRMLSVKPEERPKVDIVRQSLSALGDLNCKCVLGDLTDFELLLQKYKKVKGYYFERVSEIDQLKKILERLWASSFISDKLKAQIPNPQQDYKQAFLSLLELPDAIITAALEDHK